MATTILRGSGATRGTTGGKASDLTLYELQPAAVSATAHSTIGDTRGERHIVPLIRTIGVPTAERVYAVAGMRLAGVVGMANDNRFEQGLTNDREPRDESFKTGFERTKPQDEDDAHMAAIEHTLKNLR